MLRGADKWLPGYLRSLRRRPRNVAAPRHLVLAVCDHYEPFRGGADRETALGHVRRWADAYPRLADDFRDADGKPPQHTFFYPEEEYDGECLELLAGLTRRGYGEVEIHLHHRNDTPEGLRHKLTAFRDRLRQEHGLLGQRLTTPTGSNIIARGVTPGDETSDTIEEDRRAAGPGDETPTDPSSRGPSGSPGSQGSALG